jgi:hypothetical protein
MHVAAAIVDDPSVVIDHKLYWGTLRTYDEGLYLCAILNSPVLTELARPFMSYGKDERDIDKYIWKLPIPIYNGRNDVHLRLVQLARAQATVVSQMAFDDRTGFVAVRRQVRNELAMHSSSAEIERLIRSMLS